MKRGSADGKKEEPSRKIITRANAGDKQWKWDHYLKHFDESVKDKIIMDEVALFSVTPDENADEISVHLKSLLPEFASICDATACVGGNTMSFCKYFRNVTSIEMDEVRFQCLRQNVKVAIPNSNVHFVNMNFIDYQGNMPYFDYIFFDPP